MKKNIILLLFLIGINFTEAQSIISQTLNHHLENSKKNEFIPIIIQVKSKINLAEIKNEFIKNNIPVKKRASILAKRLQESAKDSQKEILNTIINSYKYKNLHSFWATNAIYVEINKEYIFELSKNKDIINIDLEIGLIQKIDSQSNQTNNSLFNENNVEPGIEAINVRPLWEMGYTGRGRLVFNYDTGVSPNHPSFSNRFFANFYPISQCWDGYFSPTPNGLNDHGTHTLGIMCGLVDETNDTIGAAFEAYWIANDFVTSTVEELPPVVDMITSFEWAFNPDGDLSTDYDVPDVINNSWRWYNPIDTEQCEGYVVDLMNAIETAGIGNIFSAGNDGPNNEGVKAPQRINSGLVNTFCVASLNANDENLNISTFSTRGPTQCPTEIGGSLEIYPEVAAPGQSIRSASGDDGFDVKSGTSMAAPHVTGAFLLLKEAFPYLSGEEILLALYFTATDLGVEGEDNVFGMGIIDAYAAFNYLSINNTPVDPNGVEDIVILEIENIPNEITCEESFTPNLILKNTGNNSVNGFNVFISSETINIGPIIIDEVINPDNELNINLPTIENYNFGDNEIIFKVETIEEIIEYDYHNNQKMVRFKYKPSFNIPYSENFEDGINTNIWHIFNDDFDRTWTTINTSGINGSEISAYVNLFGYNPRNEQKDELISSAINIENNVSLSFKTAYQKYNNSSKQDTLQIYLSNNCGQSFDYLIYEKGGENLETFNEITEDFIPNESSYWRQEILDISGFQNQKILLKFVTTNLRGNNIFIDDILLSNDLTELNTLDDYIKIFPNPTSNLFTISCNDCINKNMIIKDVLGKIIMKEKINSNNQSINLNGQKEGIYFLMIENTENIIPLIKI